MSTHHLFYSSNLVNFSIPPQTKLLTFKKHSNISTLLFYIAKDINEYIYFCILALQRVKYIQNKLVESDGGHTWKSSWKVQKHSIVQNRLLS